MPPALCVAADVGRSPTTLQPASNIQHLSGSGTRRTFSTRRRARTAQSERSKGQAYLPSPNLPTWLPIQRSPPPLAAYAPPPSLPHTTIRGQQNTFTLRDQAVEKFEAGLQKQGSLSSTGKMTPPAHTQSRGLPARVPALALQSSYEQWGQSSGSHDRFTPTTPAFYPSPTSPSTPTIPVTPPVPQESWNQSSPSKYPYAPYTGDRSIYPQLAHTPYLRKRSATTSSIPPSTSPVRLSPVALPIGKKLPKWREGSLDRLVSQPYQKSSYPSAGEIVPSYGYRRMSRPNGPRPMASRSPPGSYRGLCIDMPRAGSYRSASCDEFSTYEPPTSPHRQYTIDSRADSEWPETVRSLLGSDDGAASYAKDDELSLADGSRRGASDESDCAHGSLWEGQGYESGCDEDTGEDVECHSLSEGEQEKQRAPRTPYIPPAPWAEPRQSSLPDTRTTMLDEPFEIRQPSSGERSAFDSDTEDEDEGDHLPLGRRFSMLRKALKSSMSVPSLKTRLSVFSTTGSSSLETSPDSVTSLRARQTTSTVSPPRNPYILKVATDMVLDPIPPTPADVGSPELPEDPHVDAAYSPSTPATPASPQVRQTKSFIWEVSKAPLFLETPPPPLPGPPLLGVRPPNLPLPATPTSFSTPSLPLRPSLSQSSRSESFVEKWRMNVSDRLTMVDPNMSMARLEESIAKLESHAPRTSSEVDLSSLLRRSVAQRVSEEVPEPAEAEAESVHITEQQPETSDSRGVVVLGVEPSTSSPEPKPPRTSSLAPNRPIPPVPPKHRSTAGQQQRKCTERPSGPDETKPALTLLPLFDFEQAGHEALDLRLLPIRSSSLSSPLATTATTTTSPTHGHSLSADQQSYVSAPVSEPVVQEASPPRRVRAVQHQATTPPPPRALSEPGVSSFMNFSPEQKPPSKMRRLWNRVDVRTRAGGVAKGLRESFIPGS